MDHDIDLDAYFSRIGYVGPRAPTLDALRAMSLAHVQAIPFENLDVLLTRPIELEPGALFRKLVSERRGGYCFEQNGLFLEVLTRLGFDARPLSARVRLQRPRDYVPPRTHMFIRVDLDGERWLADVGVGAASLTSPLRFRAGDEQPTAHEPRRLVKEGDLWFHQILYGKDWHDVCEFTGEEMPRIDRELANWFTSTHPQSHFRNRLMAARALPDGRRLSLLNREFSIRERDGRAETRGIASAEELLTVLEEYFGLHFAPGTRFGAATDAALPWPV